MVTSQSLVSFTGQLLALNQPVHCESGAPHPKPPERILSTSVMPSHCLETRSPSRHISSACHYAWGGAWLPCTFRASRLGNPQSACGRGQHAVWGRRARRGAHREGVRSGARHGGVQEKHLLPPVGGPRRVRSRRQQHLRELHISNHYRTSQYFYEQGAQAKHPPGAGPCCSAATQFLIPNPRRRSPSAAVAVGCAEACSHSTTHAASRSGASGMATCKAARWMRPKRPAPRC